MSQTTQPGHIDEQLKEWPRSQMEENRNCLQKIAQSIFYFSCQGMALHKIKQDGGQILSTSSFSELKMKCFESGLKISYKHMNLNAQNEILQIMALKVL